MPKSSSPLENRRAPTTVRLQIHCANGFSATSQIKTKITAYWGKATEKEWKQSKEFTELLKKKSKATTEAKWNTSLVPSRPWRNIKCDVTRRTQREDSPRQLRQQVPFDGEIFPPRKDWAHDFRHLASGPLRYQNPWGLVRAPFLKLFNTSTSLFCCFE